jgi:hypothetical protein
MTGTAKPNLLSYWCFHYNADYSRPWHEQNNCYIAVTTIVGIIVGLILLPIAIFILAYFFGAANDVVQGTSVCNFFGGSFNWESCTETSFKSLGFYMFGLFWTGLTLGLLIAVIFCAIETISNRCLKITVRTIFILFLIPIPAYFPQLLAIVWYQTGLLIKNNCPLNDFQKFFSIGCTNDGLILGAIIIGLNGLIVGSIIIYSKCKHCCRDVNKQLEYHQETQNKAEQVKLLENPV